MNNLKLLGLTAGVSSLLLTGTATADFTGISIDAIRRNKSNTFHKRVAGHQSKVRTQSRALD